MQAYTVKAKDTLYRIAAKTLGNAGDWRLIAELNGLTDASIRVGQVLKIPGDFEETVNVVNSSAGISPPVSEKVRILEQNGVYFAEDENGVGMRVGKKYKKGVYRVGRVKPEEFLRDRRERLASLNLTDSEIKVMVATAENEGNLDAVNSWDSQFISFGLFQWTAGGADQPGELAALLTRIQQNFADNFQHYWGRFGLGLEGVSNKTGWLTLNGKRLSSTKQKNVLRSPLWAYRFALAGADEQVNAAQIAHALGRIGQFYFKPEKRLGGRALAELVTSEFGVALMLDNHVNRPAYVVPCIARALSACGMSPGELASGSDDDERGVLKKYLKIRQNHGSTPMTNAQPRGKVTRAHLDNGVISDQRGSFRTNQS